MDRFIPARAGNSVKPSRCGRWVSVHPRACGELSSATWIRVVSYGSSPRVRGTPHDKESVVRDGRFIPARAGNSARDRTDGAIVGVHPRACGELLSTVNGAVLEDGSSPRVRGTPSSRLRTAPRHRFIPARAGNSMRPASPGRPSSVHPRACGELLRLLNVPVDSGGSSPRVRGTLSLKLPVHLTDRFIPARAGNSASAATSVATSSVHPRACGELHVRRVTPRGIRGSSPRVRGTHPASGGLVDVDRFIPGVRELY